MGGDVEIDFTIDREVATVFCRASSLSDAEEIAKVSEKINNLVEQRMAKVVIIDFEGVKFFSSQVLGMLLNVRGKLQEYGGQVAVSGINPQLYRVFKITKLDRLFRFFPDSTSAVQELRK